MWTRQSLIYPILGLLALTALASVVSGFVINYFPVHKNIHHTLNDQFDATRSSVMSAIEQELLSIPRLARFLQGDRILRRMIRQRIAEPVTVPTLFHEKMHRLYGELEAGTFLVTDRKGTILHHANLRGLKKKSGEEGQSSLYLHGMNLALQGNNIVELVEISGVYAIQAYSPIIDKGKIIGTVMVGTDLDDSFTTIIKSLVGVSISFLDQDGVLGTSIQLQEWLPLDLEYASLASESGKIQYHEDHDRRQMNIYAPITIIDTPLVLAGHIDLSQSHQPLFESRGRLLWSAGIILALVTLMGIGTYIFLIFPLRRLHQKAQVLMEVCATDGMQTSNNSALQEVNQGGNEITVLDHALEAASFIAYTHIGKLHNQKETFEGMAHRDALTGFGNRRAFDERLDQVILLNSRRRDECKLAIMFLDLDKFKPINDTLGHDVGDGVLEEAAQRFTRCLRDSDRVFRLGGDEFAVLAPECVGETHALQMGDRINKAISQPFHILGKECTIGVSIGVSIFPDHGRDRDDLLKKADIALYAAKGEGRGRCILYDPSHGQ
ncbi:MAG: diguanylate cyclase [Magnetococcales bacterium]|nr:diguanylate cyclase [Magnetococcales bacterium]